MIEYGKPSIQVNVAYIHVEYANTLSNNNIIGYLGFVE
jgi:hypothetical protein